MISLYWIRTRLWPKLIASTGANKFHFCERHIDGLMQERRNSIANTLELCLSCTNPSILPCDVAFTKKQPYSAQERASFIFSKSFLLTPWRSVETWYQQVCFCFKRIVLTLFGSSCKNYIIAGHTLVNSYRVCPKVSCLDDGSQVAVFSFDRIEITKGNILMAEHKTAIHYVGNGVARVVPLAINMNRWLSARLL